VPVSCGGVSVRPGDVVIADETGIVVLDRDEAEPAANRAIQMQHDEIDKRRRLDAGEKLPDISGASKVLADALAKQK
jgi:regulator of RNase E activity RraA